MSTAVQMPAAPRQWDEDHDRLLNSMGAGNGDTLTANNDEETSTSSKNALRKKKGYTNSIKLFGVDLSPDNIAVAMVYFVQAVVSGFSALPWLVKPLYGFISDSVPLFGYRRRSYLVLSGLLGALSWSLMVTLVDSKYNAAFCILLGSLSVAFADVDVLTYFPFVRA